MGGKIWPMRLMADMCIRAAAGSLGSWLPLKAQMMEVEVEDVIDR